MVYSVPADPGWDLQALLDKVPELAKKAIAGGLFLGSPTTAIVEPLVTCIIVFYGLIQKCAPIPKDL